ncbi:pirin family protein [Protaetiibacter intestinalis]|uniref:Pirin family protein n=1 Tax=Protaetiibacter intestinalis TaxID=2419774 RepID=A0A387B5I1_9MICO|nr:pirin family protein [Protaetiibacter intestinalis]AYF97663.1 pirin family protein [Protaetiibacter intestinalis]
MSNLERDPQELVCVVDPEADAGTVEVLEPREVPLGGPRALMVRRTLPQRRRSLVGAWCFVDSYGPTPAPRAGVMDTPPHPHTGLQTVSWLYEGQIEHRDSTGAHQLIDPGAVNLMTAGRGIQHSEVSTTAAATLHGVQLWTALPDASRGVAPFFEHHVAELATVGEGTLRVFVGSWLGITSPVTAYTPLVAAELALPAGASVVLPADPGFEYGLVVDHEPARLNGTTVPAHHLGVVGTGTDALRIETFDGPLRVLVIGGTPLEEPIVMWWNFVGRSHDEIVAFRGAWQHEVIADADPAGRFGRVAGYDGPPLPAPELPNVRLRPRESASG